MRIFIFKSMHVAPCDEIPHFHISRWLTLTTFSKILKKKKKTHYATLWSVVVGGGASFEGRVRRLWLRRTRQRWRFSAFPNFFWGALQQTRRHRTQRQNRGSVLLQLQEQCVFYVSGPLLNVLLTVRWLQKEALQPSWSLRLILSVCVCVWKQ